MLNITNVEIGGLEPAIRGMRNPKNSWEKSDSKFYANGDPDYGCDHRCEKCDEFGKYDAENPEWSCSYVGPNDLGLMQHLAHGGPVHAKYRRMIVVWLDIEAPLYWWKEFDTYKVGTVANSCSTMHKIHAKEFTLDDFSHEHLTASFFGSPYVTVGCGDCQFSPLGLLNLQIDMLNNCREKYLTALKTEDYTGLPAKDIWWQMIQLLPSSYNQKRTIMLNYEVLAGIYPMRKNHKLDEWHTFCDWIESLPYSEIITGNTKEEAK